jgi:ABC-type multidrug transport system permease subunit
VGHQHFSGPLGDHRDGVPPANAQVGVIPMFFSSAFVPAGTMPSWLRVVTENQPVTQAVDTLRAPLLSQPPGDHIWLTLTEFGGFAAAAFTLATALFGRRSRFSRS